MFAVVIDFHRRLWAAQNVSLITITLHIIEEYWTSSTTECFVVQQSLTICVSVPVSKDLNILDDPMQDLLPHLYTEAQVEHKQL